ncbi:MAG: ATP-binding protein [Victivallaceae bacterium]
MDKKMSFTIANSMEALGGLCREVHAFMERHSLPAAAIYAIDLSLEEMATNIIKYGYDDKQKHEITVGLAIGNNQIALTLEDDGHEFNPLDAQEADLTTGLSERQVGGVGILLARSMTDSICYVRKNERNIVKAIVNI